MFARQIAGSVMLARRGRAISLSINGENRTSVRAIELIGGRADYR